MAIRATFDRASNRYLDDVEQTVLETVSLPLTEIARRTWREVIDDDVLGLAAELSFYFFLALFSHPLSACSCELLSPHEHY